jgi:hypothetical protein
MPNATLAVTHVHMFKLFNSGYVHERLEHSSLLQLRANVYRSASSERTWW